MSGPHVSPMETAGEYPRAYERMRGDLVLPGLGAAEVPIPPRWVRDHASVPLRAQYVTLAKDLAPVLGEEARKRAIELVRAWPEIVASGQSLLFAGEDSHRLEDLAAGFVHEITRLYAAHSALATAYLHPGTILRILAAREQRDEYLWRLNRFASVRLLSVLDVSEIAESPEARGLLAMIYTDRQERRLPILTTLNTNDAAALGKQGLASRVGRSVADAIASVPEAYRVYC